jgi:RHS repeat-associated protein
MGCWGSRCEIEYGAGGVVTVTDALGRVTVDGYNGYGALAVQRDAAGASQRTYDGYLNWNATTDANGHTTHYVYNRMGQPERVEDPLGNVTRMAYDDLGHLTAVTDALGYVTRYEYEGNLPITTTDALGGVVVNAYDERGLLVRVVDHGVTTTYGYDDWGQLTVMTDALGNVTTYGYDAVGRLITITEYATRTTVNAYDAADNLIRVTENVLPGYPQNWQETYNLVTEYGYDAVGNLVAVTDTLGRVTRYDYDAAKRLVRTVENDLPGYPQNWQDTYNIVTQYGYDAVGNQTHVTDTLGYVTRNGYDEANRLIRTTVNYSPTVGANHEDEWNITTWYGYDAVGNRIAVTDTLGHVTRYEYDALNRLVAVTDPLSGTTRYGYDALGRQAVITDATGVATHFAYDALGRLIETCDALGNCTDYGYDGLGNRTVMTDGNGVVTRYEYDGLSRLTAVVESAQPGQAADHQTNVRTRYGYDALGNRTVISDANGHAAHYVYDVLGRLTAEVDPLGHVTAYSYDALGRTTAITEADGIVTRYAYDALSRLTAVQYPTATVAYAYDPLGHRVVMTDATGVTTYVYDALGRPMAITSPPTGTVGYRYDALGNRTRLIYPDGRVVTNTYDALSRLSQVTTWDGQITRYFYDPAGRVLRRTLPNGVTTTYGYEGAGRLVNLTHEGRYWVLAAYTYTLDGVGNRVGVVERVLPPARPNLLPLVMRNAGGGGTVRVGKSEPGLLPEVFRSPLGLPQPEPFVSPLAPPESSHRPGGLLQAGLLLPDPLLLLLAPLALGSAAWQRKRWRWATAPAGVLLVVAVVAIGAALGGPVEAEGIQVLYSSSGERTITYDYDPLYRLTSAEYSTGERYEYAYDAVGNRTVYSETTPDGTRTTPYEYDTADRLTSVDGVAYTWDNRGNQTSNGTLTFAYDAANRLVGVSGGGAEVAYGYNGDGLRVWRTANGQTSRYTWDLAGGLPQLLSDGETLYVPGVGQYRDGEWTYTLADGLGSVRQLADGQGYVVQRYDYSPFGQVMAAEGGWANPLRYSGEQWDADAGLLYLRARWYDPATGRFLTRDPFPGLAALPQTQHPYVYVGNNPVNLVDPSGRYGRDVHYELTYNLVREEALKRGLSEIYAEYLAEQIATANQGVDNWGADNSLWSPMHWYTRVEAETLLEAAVRSGDPVEFGRALHAFQDYYSHRSRGYTIPGGLIGMGVYLNGCINYGEEFNWGGLALSFVDYGHGFSKVAHWVTLGLMPDTDIYDPSSSARDREMRERTRWWIQEFLNGYQPTGGGLAPFGASIFPFAALVRLFTVLDSDESGPDEWPMEGRDPQHTNANPAVTTLPEPHIRWSRELGLGGLWVSPVVVDGVVYLASGDKYVYALEARSSRRIWRFRMAGEPWSLAVVKGVVYVAEQSALYGLDATTGEMLWEFQPGTPAFTTLVAVNGRVYAGAVDHGVYALDAVSGELRWAFDTGNNFQICLTANNGIVYALSQEEPPYRTPEHARLDALDAESGHQVWGFEFAEEVAFHSCPVVAEGLVYIGSGEAYTRGIRLPAYVYALDAATGEERWRFRPDDSTVVIESLLSPAVASGVAYVVARQYTAPGSGDFERWSTLYAVDALTGEMLWSSRVDGRYGQIGFPPIVAGGQVYAGTEYGWVLALDAASGARVWELDVGRGNDIGASPVVVNGAMYVVSTNQVYALGSATDGDKGPEWPCGIVLAMGMAGGAVFVLLMVGWIAKRRGD